MAFDGTVPCWNPRVPIGDRAERRMRVAQANRDGYQQRIADGINVIERSWALVWETKPKAELIAMMTYLAARRGHAFSFKHPVTGVTHKVVCDKWDVNWNVSLLTTDPTLSVGAYSASARYGTMTAEFHKIFGVNV